MARSLSDIVAAFSAPLVTGRGTNIVGQFRAPQNVRATFDGLFTPRSMLLVPPGQDIIAGDTVTDADGNSFLCGTWPVDRFLGRVVAQVFVVFDAPLALTWGRPITTPDLVSGLNRLTGTKNLGTIQGLKETIGKAKDETNVSVSMYRVMTGSPIQLDDYVDGSRVTRLVPTLGLYYAETL